MPYFTTILNYNNILDWTGAVMHHNIAKYQHPWLDRCLIWPLFCKITTSLTGRVPYFTIILQYFNIPDWTGAIFYHNTALSQHPWLDGCHILPPYWIITTSLTGRVPCFSIILHNNNIPDWTGAIFYHNTALSQHHWLDGCRIWRKYCKITASLTGRVPYFTTVLNYNNIPD